MRAANSACSLRRCTGKEELATQLEELAMSVEELAMLHAVRHTCMQHHIGSPPLPPPVIRGMREPRLQSASKVMGTNLTLTP